MPLVPCGSSAQPIALVKTPVAVPADFCGLHFRGWPLYNATVWQTGPQPYPAAASPAPTNVAFGTWRAWDTGYCLWGNIEKSQGVYTWTNVDTLITTHRSAGRTVVFVLSGTPTFYVSGTDQGRQFYDVPGGAGYPASSSPNGLTALSNFITALITRYNDPSGAWRIANPGLGKGIQALETWNEPSFSGYPSSSFWWGTAGQMVDVAYTARTAAKAVDAALTVTSPGFSTQQNATAFLTATGTINTGVTGASTCDVMSVHHYNVNLPGLSFGGWNYDEITSTTVGLAGWRQAMASGGISALPLWMSEGGYDYNNTSPELTIIAAQDASWRYTFWARMMMIGAAQGFAKWLSYCWDAPYLNTPMNDPNGAAKAITDVHNNVAGKTITRASYVVGGPVSLTFSDASTFTV